MKKSWIAHCRTQEEKEDFKNRLLHNRDIFDILKNILMDKYELAVKDRRSVKSYLTQNWSEFQADRNATERTLLEIIELIDMEK